jgi:crossover junction endodeoxyribonuclease RuvC
MKVLGIDSSTHNGLALLDGDDHRVTLLEAPGMDGSQRLQLIAANFERWLNVWEPDIAYIEMYALGLQKSATTIITIIEIGTLLRMKLMERQIPWRTIKPSTCKKWTTGRGDAKKPDMAKAVKERWGFVSVSDDIVDAYALARMGQFLLEADVKDYPNGVDWGFGALPVAKA